MSQTASRIAILVSLIVLVVVISSVDVFRFGDFGLTDGSLKWVIVGLAVFFLIRSGGCCVGSCGHRKEKSASE